MARLDLRTRLRGPDSSRVLTFYLSGLGIIVAAFLLRQIDPPADQTTHPGIQLLEVLALYQIALLLVVASLSTSTLISDERRSGTWELLLLSRLSALGLLCNKLMVGLAFNLLLLVASFPLYIMVSVLYGVSLAAIARVFLMFLATVLLSASIGVAVSAVSTRSASAKAVAVALAVAYGSLSLLALLPEVATANGLLDILFGLDPFAAVLSALPGGSVGGFLILNPTHGSIPSGTPLWVVYLVAATVISTFMLLLTSRFLRSPQIVRAQGS